MVIYVTDGDICFLIFDFFLNFVSKNFSIFPIKKKKKEFVATRVAIISPTRWTGNTFF